MLMMRPLFCSRIRTVAARMVLKLPLRCTSRTASQSSSLMLKIIRSRRLPATFTRMSSRPHIVTACSTISAACRKSVTEPWLGTATPPALRISSTTWLAGDASAPTPLRLTPRSFTTTLAPAWAIAMAIPRPMPRPAPVTTAVLPSSIPMSVPPRSFHHSPRDARACGNSAVPRLALLELDRTATEQRALPQLRVELLDPRERAHFGNDRPDSPGRHQLGRLGELEPRGIARAENAQLAVHKLPRGQVGGHPGKGREHDETAARAEAAQTE